MSMKESLRVVSDRARFLQQNAKSVVEPVPMTVAASVVIYAANRIKELEAQIEAMLETAEGAGIPRCQFDDDLK